LPVDTISLADLGWHEFFADAFGELQDDNLIPARIAVRHHGAYELFSERGELGGIPAGRLVEEELPAVGDWVAVRPLPGERKAVIEASLPRRTAFRRKEAWRRTAEQVVAANVDTVFLVTSFGPDLNPRRVERYLTMAWESGAAPVIVLTKLDLADDPAGEAVPVEAIAYGVPVHHVSALTGAGLDTLEPYLGRGRTVALLGSSGVGKSTLVNRLAGREVLATREVRDDGKGRHTTSHRELVPLPGGALLLDTPGMRELQLWEASDGLATTFADVEELAAECRFSDCAHETEPGCAIRAALASGELDRARWDSYRKLQRELYALAVRQDARLGAEARKERRRFARSRRHVAW
jgi:ribosome biogenesis GTPase / thiamine phosphate phosphatase